MADLWELILHHSYTGTPGVVFDQSPRRGSHGVAVHIPDGDFLRDGASDGSGAVVMNPNSHIDVPVTSVWRPMSGVRVEVVCICDGLPGGPLIGGDNFGFGLFDGDMSASYGLASGGGGGFRTGDTGDVVPIGEWITVGYTYDGVFRTEFTLNGTTILEFGSPGYLGPAVQHVTIGNRRAPGGVYDTPFSGRIDDVKVWRVNPHYINDDFTPRNCGIFDGPGPVSPPTDDDDESDWEIPAIVIAKFVAGIALGAFVQAWAAAEIEAFTLWSEPFGSAPEPPHGDTSNPDQSPRAGDGTTLAPAGLNVPDAGRVEVWRSKRDTSPDGRTYDYVVNRATQRWWPDDNNEKGFWGRWGQQVTNDPLGRRSGPRFPNYAVMFIQALADGDTKDMFSDS